MGIHTTIYRERYLAFDDLEKYKIKLFKGKKEIKLFNPVLIREEFYFGKSAWAINEWIYQRVLRECIEPDEDLSYEYVFDKELGIKDLQDLYKDVTKVLDNHKIAEKILPMPKDLVLEKPKVRCYDSKNKVYKIWSEDDFEIVPRSEMYNDYYFDLLKRAKELLERLIEEDNGDVISGYTVEII